MIERGDGLPQDGVRLRPYRASDQAAVLDLIAADQLPGQPPADPDTLAMALAGTTCVPHAR